MLVTDDGCEVLTDFPYDLLWPQGYAREAPLRRSAVRLASAGDPAGRSPAPRQGQGPRALRPRRRPADGRLRPHLDLRRRPSDADPGQGQGAHRAVGALVRPDRGRSSPTTSCPPPTACRTTLRGRGAARAAAADAAGRVRRARLPHRLGLEGLPGDGRVSGIELPAGPAASPSSCPSRSSRPRRRPRRATTRRSTSSRRVELVGDRALAERLRDVSLAVYGAVADHARERGVILADTKFEFGLDADGELALGDEVCTPDSSRFWPADEYEPGRGQPSFDKQYVRDWAAGTGWDKSPPAPAIPDDVVAAHARALRERLRAAGRRAVLGVAGARRRA